VAYTVDNPTEFRTALFGEDTVAYFDGNDLYFSLVPGVAAYVETLTSARPVGVSEDPDGTLRLSWRSDDGLSIVTYLSRMRGVTGTWVSA
jgi:hypothetical protein